MDSARSRRKSEVMQNMLEALIRYDVIEEDEIAGSAESIVTVDTLWQLFNKVEEKLAESTANQNKELLEVQNYVEHVRHLSEERDELTAEFEKENEKLKSEIKQLRSQANAEAAEISDMCRQENLDELVGSSFSEQMAYLLVVRGTLLDKLEALEERYQALTEECDEKDEQIKVLTSEDSQLRHRVDGAMSEMGGMAAKLTDALKERDALKKEVHELSQALDGIRTLPTVKEAKIEVELHQKEMEKLKTFYTEQNAKLSEELNELSHQKQSAELEYVTQIEELEEVNEKLREVNQQLNEQLSLTVDAHHADSRKKVYAESQKIIEEMQHALEEDEAKNMAKQKDYEEEIASLKKKVTELENNQALPITEEDVCVSQLSAQLEEALNQIESKNKYVDELKKELRNLQVEVVAREAAGESRGRQYEAQVQIASDLQDRNSKLEAELAKVVVQLKDSHDELKALKRKLESMEHTSHENEVDHLKQKVEQLESLLLRDTSGTNPDHDVIKLGAELAVCQAQVEEEKRIRLDLQEQLDESLRHNEVMARSEGKLKDNITELQTRTLNAEAEILLLTGLKNQEENQKIVAELSRNQLEDAVEMMRKRIDFYIIQLQVHVNKYKNLKMKHKSKIRKIRELFLLERKSTRDEIERLERKVLSAEGALAKELEWKEKAACDIREAEQERRHAINEACRASQKADERNEQIKQLNMTNDGLVSEKSRMKEQLFTLEKQKRELERVVQAIQTKERTEEITHLLRGLSLSDSLSQTENVDYVKHTSQLGEDDLTKVKKAALKQSNDENQVVSNETSLYLNLTAQKPNAAPRRGVF